MTNRCGVRLSVNSRNTLAGKIVGKKTSFSSRKGPVAQLVMRRIRIAEITGSTPVRSTLYESVRRKAWEEDVVFIPEGPVVHR